jgi:hypothetical protein
MSRKQASLKKTKRQLQLQLQLQLLGKSRRPTKQRTKKTMQSKRKTPVKQPVPRQARTLLIQLQMDQRPRQQLKVPPLQKTTRASKILRKRTPSSSGRLSRANAKPSVSLQQPSPPRRKQLAMQTMLPLMHLLRLWPTRRPL